MLGKRHGFRERKANFFFMKLKISSFYGRSFIWVKTSQKPFFCQTIPAYYIFPRLLADNFAMERLSDVKRRLIDSYYHKSIDTTGCPGIRSCIIASEPAKYRNLRRSPAHASGDCVGRKIDV